MGTIIQYTYTYLDGRTCIHSDDMTWKGWFGSGVGLQELHLNR